MGVFEWIAILGAAAWVPQVAGWISRALVKPRLKVIPSNAPEIGFSSLGPIFNLTCAISAEKKDGIIERITARVRHERGHTNEFKWATLNEVFSQVRSTEGIAEVSKNQPAIALKVSTLVLTEKQIAMQEVSFEQDSRPLVQAVMAHHDFLRKSDPDYRRKTIGSAAFDALMTFARHRFPWQEGNYTVALELRIAGVIEPTVQTFHFSLTASDVDRLRANLDEINRYTNDLVEAPDPLPVYQWNWVYPPFTDSVLLSPAGSVTKR